MRSGTTACHLLPTRLFLSQCTCPPVYIIFVGGSDKNSVFLLRYIPSQVSRSLIVYSIRSTLMFDSDHSTISLNFVIYLYNFNSLVFWHPSSLLLDLIKHNNQGFYCLFGWWENGGKEEKINLEWIFSSVFVSNSLNFLIRFYIWSHNCL